MLPAESLTRTFTSPSESEVTELPEAFEIAVASAAATDWGVLVLL